MKRSLSWRRMRRNQHDIDTARRARSLILGIEQAIREHRWQEATTQAVDLVQVLDKRAQQGLTR
jgi:hypothetical protein